jgi:hypothetical protein
MSDWKENLGLADDTDVAKIYTKSDIKEEWKREAELHDRSLSRHLFLIIQEARWLQKEGELTFSEPSERRMKGNLREEDDYFRELEEQVRELTSLLQDQSDGSEKEAGDVVEAEWVRDLVDSEGRELDGLLDSLLEHPGFRSQIKKELEKKLYELGAEEEVVYRRRQGWKEERAYRG